VKHYIAPRICPKGNWFPSVGKFRYPNAYAADNQRTAISNEVTRRMNEAEANLLQDATRTNYLGALKAGLEATPVNECFPSIN